MAQMKGTKIIAAQKHCEYFEGRRCNYQRGHNISGNGYLLDWYSYHIWRAWYHVWYTMIAKPIRALELHYPMIPFLKIHFNKEVFFC